MPTAISQSVRLETFGHPFSQSHLDIVSQTRHGILSKSYEPKDKYADLRDFRKEGHDDECAQKRLCWLFSDNISTCIISHSHLKLFAEDTPLISVHKNLDNLKQLLFSDGSSLLEWRKQNYLLLCVYTSKTQLIDFFIRNPMNQNLNNVMILDAKINWPYIICKLLGSYWLRCKFYLPHWQCM